MDNHFHLLVQTPQANLSEFMRRFLVTYTVRFNRRNGSTGHVFQGRKSERSLVLTTAPSARAEGV
jgi:putative transposase